MGIVEQWTLVQLHPFQRPIIPTFPHCLDIPPFAGVLLAFMGVYLRLLGKGFAFMSVHMRLKLVGSFDVQDLPVAGFLSELDTYPFGCHGLAHEDVAFLAADRNDHQVE